MDGFGHHLGSMLVIYGAVLAHLGTMLAHLGGYDGPSWGFVATCLVLLGISCIKKLANVKAMENTMINKRFWQPSWLYVGHL